MARRVEFWLTVPVAALALVGCSLSSGPTGTSPNPTQTGVAPSSGPTSGGLPTAAPTGGPIRYPTHCTAQDSNELPDPSCTPGVLNPAVTPATIAQTICRTGWTQTVRPPVSYTGQVKTLAIPAYGNYAGVSRSAYELDHLIPLELGGAPWDVRNLWPEHPASTNPKDDVEFAARQAVCAGRMALATAQQEIANNWITLGHQLHVSGVPTS